jgi:hypothetical protein
MNETAFHRQLDFSLPHFSVLANNLLVPVLSVPNVV